jgi:hypothetical protein
VNPLNQGGVQGKERPRRPEFGGRKWNAAPLIGSRRWLMAQWRCVRMTFADLRRTSQKPTWGESYRLWDRSEA